jgi:uncharacterized protein (TIGR02594 family)
LFRNSLGKHIDLKASRFNGRQFLNKKTKLKTLKYELRRTLKEYLKSTADYLKEKSMISSVKDINDEIAWCSAFVNWCIEKSGNKGTSSAWAKDWNDWGKKITTPTRGCIVVLNRKGGGGHVGLYISETPEFIIILGGNQNLVLFERQPL